MDIMAEIIKSIYFPKTYKMESGEHIATPLMVDDPSGEVIEFNPFCFDENPIGRID